jgi:hypothetical protein
MHLPEQEVERFYRIWFPLLNYVNEKQNLVPSFPAEWEQSAVAPETAMPLREALWADDSLREAFIADNPAGLSTDDLALIESWKDRVAGNFYIFRHLKKYTVFVSEDSPARGYGVLGLVTSLEEIIGSQLPIYVRAVLLPFEGQIIYDSLLAAYSVYFGGGIRSSLNDTYRGIQEREGIITTLPPKASSPKDIQARNKKILTAFQKELGRSGLSPKKMEAHTQTIAQFAETFLQSQKPPSLLLDISGAQITSYLAAQTAPVDLVSFKRFTWFLRDTWRIDYDEAEDLLDLIKREQRR